MKILLIIAGVLLICAGHGIFGAICIIVGVLA